VTLLFALLAMRGHAIIFTSTGDPSYNTNAPTGSLTNSGWQYEGQWNTGVDNYNYLGTPIAPQFFAAAQHVGGTNGEAFVYNGFTYHTVASFDCPNSDLRIWQVAETFPSYAPLYTNSNEVGSVCVVIGRGYGRSNPVIVSGVTNGWAWDTNAGVERWGENTVSGISTDGSVGQLVYAIFDRNGITNECTLTVGDSSGAMFIKDGTTWKLAGIHYSVSDFTVSTNGVDGSGFNASMMDYYGVYLGGDGHWTLQTSHLLSAFYSTRISALIGWINSVIDYEPGPDLCITGNRCVGADEQISLSTGSNRLYRVDYTSDMVTAVWTTLTNNVAGTGGTVTITDPGAASQPQRFYRVAIVQ
jgi:hypothetical protein